MALRTVFKFAGCFVRFLQVAALSFTTYAVCYSIWTRKGGWGSDAGSETPQYRHTAIHEVLMLIASAVLAIEIFANSDVSRTSDLRLSVMSLAVYTVGLSAYVTTPEIQQTATLTMASFGKGCLRLESMYMEGMVYRKSMEFGIVTWAISVVFVLFSVIDFAERAKRVNIPGTVEGECNKASLGEKKLGQLVDV